MVVPFVSAVVLASAAAIAPQEPDSTRVATPPIVERRHSIARLLAPQETGDLQLHLAPTRHWEALHERVDAATAAVVPLYGDELEDFIRRCVAPGQWGSGRCSIEFNDDELVVAAPEEVQAEVAMFLAQLAQALDGRAQLQVRVVSPLPGDLADLARSGAGPRPLADADRALAAAQAQGATLVRSATLALRAALHDRIAQRAQSGTRGTFVSDWEVVICGSSAGADPIVVELFAGLELEARCEAVEGGTLLALALSASEPAAPTARFESDAVATMHRETTLFTRPACGVIDLPRSSFLSLSGELFLPEGMTVRLPCRHSGAGGAFDWILEIDVAGPRPPPPDRPGQQLLDRTMSLPQPPPAWLFDDGWATWVNDRAGEEKFTSALIGQLAMPRRSDARPDDRDGGGDGGGAAPDRLADALAGALTIDVTLLDAQGRSLAAFTASPLGGRRLVVAQGIEGRRVARWSLDVADAAATMDPVPEAWVDGLVLSLAPSRDGAGRVLHVVAAACALDELPRRRALDDMSRLAVEELSARRLHLDQLVALPDEGGTVELGGGDLTLVLRCRPLTSR